MGVTVVVDHTVYQVEEQSDLGNENKRFVIPGDVAAQCMQAARYAIEYLERAEGLKVEYVKISWVKRNVDRGRINPRFHLKLRLPESSSKVREMWLCPYWWEACSSSPNVELNYNLQALVAKIVDTAIEELQDERDDLSREKSILESALEAIRLNKEHIPYDVPASKLTSEIGYRP